MKLYGILLIAVLVVVSGVIAYVGDILGRWLGRRRVSMFGLRPRHTAMAISIVVGMLIAGWTLAVAMAVSSEVRDAFTRVVALRLEVGSLRRQTRDLQRRQRVLRARADSSRAATRRAQAERAKAEAERKKAQEAVAGQRRELGRVSRELGRAEEEVFKLTAEAILATRKVRSLEQQREGLEQQVAGLMEWSQRELRTFYTAPLVAHAGEPLANVVVDASKPKAEIREALRALADRIEEDAKARGAAGGEGERASTIRLVRLDPKTNKVTVYRQEAVLGMLADAVAEHGGGVVVQAVSLVNTVKGETLWVDFRLFANRLIYHKGDVVAEARVDGTTSQAEIMAALVSLLRDEVGPRAREEGVLPSPSPRTSRPLVQPAGMPVGEVSVGDLLAVAREIERGGKMARVQALALADTWTAGPLKVQLNVVAGAAL